MIVDLLPMMIALGLIPVALVFIFLGYFAARVAKKRGKNQWLWGSISVVVLTALSWQQLPKWAGYSTEIELYVIHSAVSPWQNKVADPNAVESFALSARQRTTSAVPDLPKNKYTFNIPARYRATQRTADVIWLTCKYPSMEASPGSPLSEKVVKIHIGTEWEMRMPQFFLNQVAENKVFGEYVGKQGIYDIYQTKNVVTGGFDKRWLFTAEDRELVSVESGVMDSIQVWHNIGNDLVVDYMYWPVVGSDYIKIDEVVMDFVKAHLKSQPIQNNATDKRSSS